MEWNIVEKAIKAERDTRTELKGVGQVPLVYVFDINSNTPSQ